MSRRRTILSIPVMLAATLLIASLVYRTPVAARGNPRATGGGTTIELGEKSTFVFNAVQLPDGTVNGHLVYHIRGGDHTFHMDIDCLNIIGNRAVLSGRVTRVAGEVPPFLSVGTIGVFQVEDNGEGRDDPPDRISDVFIFRSNSSRNCLNFFPQPLYLPIDGNIQVQP